MKKSLRVEIPENFSQHMIGFEKVKAEKKSAAEFQQTSFEVDAQTKVSSFSGATWRRIFNDASARNLIANISEQSALKSAMKIPEKIPATFQCEKLLLLLKRLEENGLTYEPDNELS